MPKILYADNDYPDVDLERALFDPVGIEIVTAQCKTEEQVIAAGAGCRGILLQYAPIGAKVVAALPELGIVSRIGAGFDTVDTEACEKAGIWVANSPDYGVGEVATHALALALASIRNIVSYHRDIQAGRWHFMSPGTMRRPSELTLGIVGLGRIGKRMAHISRNVFKRVVAYDPHIIDGDFPAYVERVATLDDLARQSDVVSLHTPLNAETRGMIDARFFGAVRPGACFVNTARGAVVKLPDLVAALDAGTLAGACLDVLPEEPVPRDSPLLRHPRAILTPHAAFYSLEAEKELRRKAAQNIITWLATGRPEYVVTSGTRTP
ncbi:MAG TPA: C-terminal binding protein [Casimicrobiaceae bacterium]|nr:C-terminal binding protein [Casimicrobiaceae bacterium]